MMSMHRPPLSRDSVIRPMIRPMIRPTPADTPRFHDSADSPDAPPAAPPLSGIGPAFAVIWSITAGATFLQVANGLLQILLPLRMDAAGMSIGEIGLVASGYGLGFAAGCMLVPLLVRHVGHIRAFASLAAISAVVALGFTQAEELWSWILLRTLSGMVLAGLFTVIDGWVSAGATAANRGRVVSLYMLCTKIALMLSPLAIGLGSIETDGLFMAIAALMCLSLIPVSATLSREPPAPRTISLIIPTLFRKAPSAVTGAFAVGLMNSSVIAIAPVYGIQVGLGATEAALLFLALQAGSLILQWPMGWLSDRTDRRRVIAGLFAGTALACIGIVVASHVIVSHVALVPALIIAFAIWGGMALCIYAVCIAHACDIIEADMIVPAISSLLVCWAAGGMFGPFLATTLMAATGPQGLFVFCGVIATTLAGFVTWRIRARERPPAQGGFVNLPATSAGTAELSPRAHEDGVDGDGGAEDSTPPDAPPAKPA